MLREENRSAAEALSEAILQNGKKIWQRGIYYRENLKRYPNDIDFQNRVASILKYASTIIVGIEQIWMPMPEKLGTLRDELQKIIMDELI